MLAILGATGKVGLATIRTLLAGGHPVRAIVRHAEAGAQLAAAGCELAVAHGAELSEGSGVALVRRNRGNTVLDVAAAISRRVGREVVARELPRAEWLPVLRRGGIGDSYARLVVELYDAHNAGRIDAQPGVGELRRGTSELGDLWF